MIVVDQGLELFTLYGYLSEIAVKPGQSVARDEALGRSGETGLDGPATIDSSTVRLVGSDEWVIA